MSQREQTAQKEPAICKAGRFPKIMEQILDAPETPESPSIKRSVRILVVDDHPTILEMVKRILSDHVGFEVVGEARDGLHAVAQAGVLKPDVIVINVTMPKMCGFEATQRIRERLPNCAIVILSSHKDEQFIAEARKAGAKGYVKKSDANQQLIHAIGSAIKGEEFFVVE